MLLSVVDEGRVCMYSATGEKEFDRYVTDNKPTVYRQALTASSGELLFLGSGSRLVKLGHGLYVSDVKITKPVNGTATAVFTCHADRICHYKGRGSCSCKCRICHS